MQYFYSAWGIVAHLIDADMEMPKEVNLPNPLDRQVALQLVQRRDFTVLEVIHALAPISQPHLLQNNNFEADTQNQSNSTDSIISPIPQIIQ